MYNSSHSYDVICVTETWLTDTVSNAMIDPKGLFSVFRHDRNDRAGGGVCILVRLPLFANLVDCNSNSLIDCELICIDLLNVSSKVRIINIYRPGCNSENGFTSMQTLLVTLNEVCISQSTIICGDFNCPGINWEQNCVRGNRTERLFYDAISDLGFIQMISGPTRGTNQLDLVLSNDPYLVINCQILSAFSTSDHDSVTFNLNCTLKSQKANLKLLVAKTLSHPVAYAFVWAKADWVSLAEYYDSVDWGHLQSSHVASADDIWSQFYNILMTGIHLYVPKWKGKSNSSGFVKTRNCVKSYPFRIKKLIRRKRILWRRYKKKSTLNRKTKFYTAAKSVKRSIDLHEIAEEHKVLNSNNRGIFLNMLTLKCVLKVKLVLSSTVLDSAS